jgi:hypothetical protein
MDEDKINNKSDFMDYCDEAHTQENMQEQLKLKNLLNAYKNIWNSKDGKIVLLDIIQNKCRFYGYVNCGENTHNTSYCDGMNSVARLIINQFDEVEAMENPFKQNLSKLI